MRKLILGFILCSTTLPPLLAAPVTDGHNFSPEGYRVKNYRAPTPDSTSFATTITANELRQLLENKPALLLIDVFPLTWYDGIFFQDSPHYGIPGSIWLPNIGLGKIDARTMQYMRDHLPLENKERGLVFYCKIDCWMSWNAAKRAAEMGFQQVYWFKDGIDAWINAGFETAILEPEQ
ncbi:MAG: PQQ-dependent catabolism-associated CXXCW motif protein [Neptuniibacter sp.]